MCVEYLIYIRKKETDVLCKMINRHFWTKKSTNLLTFLYSKKHIILYKKTKYNNIYINNQNIQKDILLKNTTTMKKRIHLTETGNFHIGETDVDEKCTK